MHRLVRFTNLPKAAHLYKTEYSIVLYLIRLQPTAAFSCIDKSSSYYYLRRLSSPNKRKGGESLSPSFPQGNHRSKGTARRSGWNYCLPFGSGFPKPRACRPEKGIPFANTGHAMHAGMRLLEHPVLCLAPKIHTDSGGHSRSIFIFVP